MLATASLGKSFWAEAVNTACYAINRSPSTAVELKTPIEMWTGKPVNYSDLHIFVSPMYVMYNSQETTKLDPKSRKCLFLGYADGVKGYRLWDPTAHKVVVSRDVVFMEDKVQENEEGVSTTRETTTIHMEKEIQSNDSSLSRTKQQRDLHLEQLDVKTAFLHGNLEEEIYMLQPEGPNKDRISKLKAQLAREFEMKDLGPANKILGMQIHRDRVSRKIWLSQKSYVKKILQRFNMQDCKPISTPFATNIKLSSKKSLSMKKRDGMSRVPYASAVRSLMFAMICTRPDIAHAVGVVSRYMAEPGRGHWEALKRILRYIKGTSDVALCYEESGLTVKGYVDSDYAGDLDGIVAMSTTEAEYVATALASKETVWLKDVFGGTLEEGTVDMQKIHTDNNVADYMTKAINCDKFIWCRSSCGLAET
ncbi:retrovirus-related pol polyprotein from transposon TNT 1-94 [Tanacetum coccineum]|uniref:Retrovirus-related pol polyprotein from transposon TNT 1-94 n=1 Tax=Tanacetum coccineum TaxID=301880 RepID=A0ABQ4YRR3_9ASTR